ncbi:MAG: SCO family protein [Candidatus Poribacteria bacterium]|nr:SCO family protein [Candidatus Poribacteria bacterium]
MRNRTLRTHPIWMIGVLWTFAAMCAVGQNRQANLLDGVDFEQRLNEKIPLDATFFDERGERVALKELFDDKPVILSLGYFECPNICQYTRQGLLESVKGIDYTAGEDFDIVYVSIDPGETPTTAKAYYDDIVRSYGRDGSEDGWHFLTTPNEETIRRVADSVGFQYVYDKLSAQYAHPSGIVVATPDGKISRYLFGIQYDAIDLRLSLVDASNSKVGSLADVILLRCYHYDAVQGKYNLAIWKIIRVAGTITVLALGGMMWFWFRREQTERPIS